MSENLIKLQHFFEVDNRLKKEIYDICPPNDYVDRDSLIKYTDKLYESINYIFSELKEIANDFFKNNQYILSRIDAIEKVVKDGICESGIDINNLKKLYRYCISEMKEEFLNSVKENCVGYKFCSSSPIYMTTTINELIHYFHSYVLNNEHLLGSVPLISEKMNKSGYPIKLRGLSIDSFNDIHAKFPFDLDCGYTDMVAVSDKKLIMMVRDRGHALSIEITLKGDQARIEYFIPKICSVNMINNLPGINRINENSVGATGIFEVDRNDLNKSLFDFISKVPTDTDMIRERNSIQAM